jgi:hypothetical protein
MVIANFSVLTYRGHHLLFCTTFADWSQKSDKKIIWQAVDLPFDGIPSTYIAKLRFTCRFGAKRPSKQCDKVFILLFFSKHKLLGRFLLNISSAYDDILRVYTFKLNSIGYITDLFAVIIECLFRSPSTVIDECFRA